MVFSGSIPPSCLVFWHNYGIIQDDISMKPCEREDLEMCCYDPGTLGEGALLGAATRNGSNTAVQFN